MNNILLLPPICFIIVGLGVWGVSKLISIFVMAPAATHERGKEDAYACGEVYQGGRIEPDYGAFFRFAVFFTIIDVAGLMIATLAAANFSAVVFVSALIYIIVLFAVLAILYSK
ncbi:MAG: NADH-quinone oxidoreductase subunit A [Elusimicrobiota bacterium]|jgi:NADH:ubiquinone oxidoreductase subunit 3 (subunit A)|nr:NADH-quinone oxidoreductase subunit A [Elusimicrobiota bacterium]